MPASTEVPQGIDDLPQFLFLDFYGGLLFLTCFMIGILMGATLVGLAVGVVAVLAYEKGKGGKHPMFMLHAAYWFLPAVVKFKRTPASHLRFWLG